jgi:hypothetical protein
LPIEDGMTEVSTLVQEGMAAVKGGRQDEARELLMRAVALDDHNEQAWLWLSGVAEGIEDQIICLENVLVINPANSAAERGLRQLRAKLPATPEVSVPLAPMEEEPSHDVFETASDLEPDADLGPMQPATAPPAIEEEAVYEVRFGSDYDTRPQGLMSLVASWIAALSFNRHGAYEHEVFSASAGRTVGGIILGGVIIPFLVGLVATVLLVSSMSPDWFSILPTLAAVPFVAVAAILALIIQFYVWAGSLYVVSWAIGGKASFAVHTHLLSVAYAAASLLGSFAFLVGGALLAALVEIPAGVDLAGAGLVSVIGPAVLGLLVSLYALAMHGQALATAHRISWLGGIGVLVVSSLLYGLLVVLAVMALLLVTNVTLADLPLPVSPW